MTILSYKDAEGRWHWPKANLGETKDYGINLAVRMADEGDTIQTVSWVLPYGLTNADTDFTSQIAKIWLQCDSIGKYTVDCEVETTEGAKSQKYIFKTIIEVV